LEIGVVGLSYGKSSTHGLQGVSVFLLVNGQYHFIWTEYLNGKHDWSSLLGLEHSSFGWWDVQDAVVPRRILDKWDVNGCWKILIYFGELLLKDLQLYSFWSVFHLAKSLRDFCEALDEFWCGQERVKFLPLNISDFCLLIQKLICIQ
jgi:hypothetical protein